MKNLRTLGKRFYFKLVFHIIIISILIIFSINTIKDNVATVEAGRHKIERLQEKQDSLILVYKRTKDSLDKENSLLAKQLVNTNTRLDSIIKKQGQINTDYEEEINVIRNATLLDHNNWFYAKLDSIKRYYKPDLLK